MRNGGPDGYRATRSDQAGLGSGLAAQALQAGLSAATGSRTVSGKLRRKWSPEQIAGWLERAPHPGEPQNQVSHETIYRSLFIQARGVLKKELLGQSSGPSGPSAALGTPASSETGSAKFEERSSISKRNPPRSKIALSLAIGKAT